MKHIYHSHTTYCNHSSFSIEQLILYAIKKKYKTIGISEHMPPNVKYCQIPKWRIRDLTVLKQFLKEAQFFKKKYSKQIRVLVGLECEILDAQTLEDNSEFLKSLYHNSQIDYLILGHHMYPDGEHVYFAKPSNKDLKEYVKWFKIAIDLGVFLYVAHPDAFYKGFGKIDKNLIWATKEIINYASEKKVVLGINVNSMVNAAKNEFTFPHSFFWKLAAEKNIKAVIELDAHDSKPFEQKYINKALSFAKKHKIKLKDFLI